MTVGCVRPSSSSKLVFVLKSYPHTQAALRAQVDSFNGLFHTLNTWSLSRSGRGWWDAGMGLCDNEF